MDFNYRDLDFEYNQIFGSDESSNNPSIYYQNIKDNVDNLDKDFEHELDNYLSLYGASDDTDDDINNTNDMDDTNISDDMSGNPMRDFLSEDTNNSDDGATDGAADDPSVYNIYDVDDSDPYSLDNIDIDDSDIYDITDNMDEAYTPLDDDDIYLYDDMLTKDKDKNKDKEDDKDKLDLYYYYDYADDAATDEIEAYMLQAMIENKGAKYLDSIDPLD